jgi:microcin C transport system substrate-binding protein
MDRQKARDLLRQAGWIVNPKTGILEKNGKRFTFKFLTRDASSEKFLNMYAEELKDVGIELVIDKKDWAAWARDMDEFNFEMTWAAWGSGIFKDPEGMWSSREADRRGGSNITGFKDRRVDELIETQKQMFDIRKRNEIYRKIDEIIFQTHPYVLLWNINYTRLLYWNKFGMPPAVLSKYGDESSAYWFWWLDEDSYADLNDAVKYRLILPPKKESVFFDDIFRKTN